METKCGSLFFFSNFDSGNLAKVEQVEIGEESSSASKTGRDEKNTKEENVAKPSFDFEYNIWTKPDCMGTEYENGNRTWFYFGVKGGQIGKTVKMNVMNMNKQSRLYCQGMMPFVKVVGNGKDSRWERIKNRVSYQVKLSEVYLLYIRRFSYSAYCKSVAS